jgi:hypothetical protein
LPVNTGDGAQSALDDMTSMLSSMTVGNDRFDLRVNPCPILKLSISDLGCDSWITW